MSLLALISIGAAGAAVSAWGLGRGGRAARAGAAVGVLCLIAVLVVALTMDAPRAGSGPVPAGAGAFDGRLVANDYLRLVIGLWALDATLLVLVGWLVGGLAGLRGLLPATLAAIVGATVAFAAADLTVGALAAGAVGLAALAVLLVGDGAVAAAARELRVALAGAAVLVIVIAVAPPAAAFVLGLGGSGAGALGPAGAGREGEAGGVVGLLAIAVALVVAVRLGVIPFHLRVPRLADVAPPIALPLLLAWIPVPLVVAALAVSDGLVAPLALPLDAERSIIVAVALFTLAAGALAAFVQDDLRHTTGYLVIADAGIVLLGFAVLGPAAWGPTRTWLVVMAASKTAVAAWSAVAEDRFATRSVPDLRGWLRHSPILGAGLAVAAVATFGLPGWAALDARLDLARLASGRPMDALLVLAGLATLPTYVRLLALGVRPATSRVRGAAPERFVRGRQPFWRPSAGPPQTAPDAASVADASQEVPAEATAEAAPTPGTPAVGVATRARSSVSSFGTRVSSFGRGVAPFGTRVSSFGRGVAPALRRDRTELTAAAVLALAILAALTSWGALDIGGAASEPAPIATSTVAD